MRKRAGGEAGLEVEVVRSIVRVQQDVSGDGHSCKSTPGVLSSKGGPSSVGMGVGRGLEFDSDGPKGARPLQRHGDTEHQIILDLTVSCFLTTGPSDPAETPSGAWPGRAVQVL